MKSTLLSDRHNFICPISQQIFNKPVIAMDGYIYEKDEIKKWFKYHNTSPMKQKIISTCVTKNYIFNELLKEFLKNNPHELDNMYVIERNHLDFQDKVKRHIENKKFNKLLDYKKFSFNELYDESFESLIRNGDAQIFSHVINNMINLEFEDNWRPIHFVCRYGTFEMLKLLVDKGVNLECENNDKWRPIHFVCRHGTFEMLKLLLDKGVNLECETNSKWRPIHFVCHYGTFEMLKLLVDKGVNLECVTNSKWRPIHFVCRNGTIEMLQLLVNKEVNLECDSAIKWKPIHAICHYGTFDTIKYFLTKNTRLDTKIAKYNDDDADYGIIELIGMNDKLTNDDKMRLLDLITEKEAEPRYFFV